jgi:spore germination protein YaaH
MPAALASTLANAATIDTASPFWYAIVGDSTVEPNPGAGATAVVAELRADGVRVVPTVTEDAGIEAFGRLLESSSKRTAFVRALVSIATAGGYSGLDLDFEQLALDRRHDRGLADRIGALYPGLIAQACGVLHAIDRTCEVTVMPRTTSAHIYWRGHLATWVYDYHALGNVADRVQVMAYDQHTPNGPPGPVAALPWVRHVIAYARSQMPLSRVELGVPAYGYDWSAGSRGTAVSARQAQALATQVHASVRWSAVAAEDTFTYRSRGRRHTVWFEDATADYDRATLAGAGGLAGIAIWAAGDEDPALWGLVRRLEHHP